MFVIADPSDGFSALPAKDILVPLSDEQCWANVNNLLTSLSELFPLHAAPRLSCFGAAVASAFDALVRYFSFIEH
jgi:hypothetical protein